MNPITALRIPLAPRSREEPCALRLRHAAKNRQQPRVNWLLPGLTRLGFGINARHDVQPVAVQIHIPRAQLAKIAGAHACEGQTSHVGSLGFREFLKNRINVGQRKETAEEQDPSPEAAYSTTATSIAINHDNGEVGLQL